MYLTVVWERCRSGRLGVGSLQGRGVDVEVPQGREVSSLQVKEVEVGGKTPTCRQEKELEVGRRLGVGSLQVRGVDGEVPQGRGVEIGRRLGVGSLQVKGVEVGGKTPTGGKNLTQCSIHGQIGSMIQQQGAACIMVQGNSQRCEVSMCRNSPLDPLQRPRNFQWKRS